MKDPAPRSPAPEEKRDSDPVPIAPRPAPGFPETRRILEQALAGDREKLGDLFERYRSRLHAMVSLRIDPRLQGRVGASDVLQEAFLEALRSFGNYRPEKGSSFYMWLRCVTARRLRHAHRFHLGAQARDLRREVASWRDDSPYASSEALAARLIGRWTTPSQVAMRAERRLKVLEALDSMSDTDREIIALRHFEQLSNAETAEVLGIETAAASKRHIRAMLKLKGLLGEDPR